MSRPKGKNFFQIKVYLRPETINFIRKEACKHDYSTPSHFLRVLTVAAINEIQGKNRLSWLIDDLMKKDSTGKDFLPFDNYLKHDDIEFIKTRFSEYLFNEPLPFARSLIETAVEDFRSNNLLGLRKAGVDG